MKGVFSPSEGQDPCPSYKVYGIIGIIIMLVAQTLAMHQVPAITVFLTPIAWTGYILCVDAAVFKRRGDSFIHTRRTQFLAMLPISIACWMIFELYNLHLQNWRYFTAETPMTQAVIACWAFATIFPGILETSELIDTLLNGNKATPRHGKKVGRRKLYSYVVVGVILLATPLLVPTGVAQYLFGLVWVGFVFLLDPLNHVLGMRSLFNEREQGRIDKVVSLFVSGTICGFLWEFWNYWATTRWVYTLPFPSMPRIFEMPLIGFVGFLPFAVECYVMYYFVLRVVKRVAYRAGLPIKTATLG